MRQIIETTKQELLRLASHKFNLWGTPEGKTYWAFKKLQENDTFVVSANGLFLRLEDIYKGVDWQVYLQVPIEWDISQENRRSAVISVSVAQLEDLSRNGLALWWDINKPRPYWAVERARPFDVLVSTPDDLLSGIPNKELVNTRELIHITVYFPKEDVQ